MCKSVNFIHWAIYYFHFNLHNIDKNLYINVRYFMLLLAEKETEIWRDEITYPVLLSCKIIA